METQRDTPAPHPRQQEDVVVKSNHQRVFVFEPRTLRAQAWLARNVPADYHVDGSVVCGPLKAAQLVMWLALAGLAVK